MSFLSKIFRKEEEVIIAAYKKSSIWTNNNNEKTHGYLLFCKKGKKRTTRTIGEENLGSNSKCSLKLLSELWIINGSIPEGSVYTETNPTKSAQVLTLVQGSKS